MSTKTWTIKLFAGAALALALTFAGTATAAAPAPEAMAPCATEDSPGPCYWDASSRGNGHGRSFWVDAQQHVHYV